MNMFFQRVVLGIGPVGSLIRFHVHDSPDYLANVLLVRGNTTVGTWESTEAVGKTCEEPLDVAGFYNLQITVTFIAETPTDFTVDMTLERPDGTQTSETVTFTGAVLEDLGRVVADFLIQ